jgi:WD40 repeat protein/serine/threonine protein kinase
MPEPLAKLGKYQIVEEIGRGGMGAVYKGHDPFLNRTVAIKLLAPHLVWEKDFVERFLREARAVAQLHHPNIINIHDVGQDGNNYYFVMAYLPGGSLKQIIAQKGRLAPADVLPLLRQLADALDYAHGKGLVHRDVKPVNMMFDERGQAILTDFGIVKAVEESRLTSTGASIGTPHYMAPEQVLGQEVTGIVAFEMLTGRVPFDADTTTAILFKQVNEAPPSVTTRCPDLPTAVEPVLNRALAKSPADRYASCGEFVTALQQALALPQPTVSAPLPTVRMQAPAPAPAAAPTPQRKVPSWAWIAGGLAVLACLVVASVLIGGTALLGSKWKSATPTSAIAIRPTDVPVSTQALPPTPTRTTSPVPTVTRSQLVPTRTPTAQAAPPSTPSVSVRFVQSSTLDKGGKQVGWSPDGKLIALASDKLYVYDAQTLSQVRAIGPSGSVSGFAFSPDGTILAVLTNEVKLYDVATGSELRTLPQTRISSGAASGYFLAFSPDGKTLAVVIDKTVKLFEVASGREAGLIITQDSAYAIAFMPDGKFLVAGGWSSLKLWDVASGQEVQNLGERLPGVNKLALARDGTRLAAGTTTGAIQLREPLTGRELGALSGHQGIINGLTFSPDGKLLASASGDVTVKVWDVASGVELQTLIGHVRDAQGVAFSPDGRQLATTAQDGTTLLWSASTGAAAASTATPTRAPARPTPTRLPLAASAISPDNAGKVAQASVLDKGGKQVAWSPDGKLLALASDKVYLYNGATLEPVRTIGQGTWMNGLTFSPDGTILAVLAGEVKLYDTATGGELRTLARTQTNTGLASGYFLSFSPDGATLAVVVEKTVKLFDVASGREMSMLIVKDGASAIAFAPDGRTLAVSSWSGGVQLLDTTDEQNTRSLSNQMSAHRLVFSPDGSKLAVSTLSAAPILLWETLSGRELPSPAGHKDTVNSLAFSPDGRVLASASNDVTIKLWDVASGRELATLKGHTNSVQDVVFSPDGARLVSTAQDGTTRVWEVK